MKLETAFRHRFNRLKKQGKLDHRNAAEAAVDVVRERGLEPTPRLKAISERIYNEVAR